MQINYKARHTELDQQTIDYCKKRFSKFTKLLPEPSFLEVEFINEFGDRGGLDKRVQVDLSIPGQKRAIHLDNRTADWQSSIDFLQERLEQEIKRLHEKNIDNGRHPKKYKVAEEIERESGEID